MKSIFRLPSGDISRIITLTLTYPNQSAATAAAVSFAPIKYNKQYAIVMQKDDGSDGDQFIMNYLRNGRGYNNEFVGIPTYSDGCGKTLNYKHSFAVFAAGNNGADLHNTPGNQYTTIEEYAAGVRDGYVTIMNHAYGGVDDDYTDRGYALKQNERYFYTQLLRYGVQYRLKAHVVPASDEGFTYAAYHLGYRMICSEFGNQSSDDKFDEINWGSQLRIDNLNDVSKPILVTRHYIEDIGSSIGLADYKRQIDLLFSHSDGNQTNMPGSYCQFDFSHGPGIIEADLINFVEIVQYLKNHPSNTDNLWVACTNELQNYYAVKQNTVKSAIVEGNQLVITLDTSAVPDDNEYFDMSLNATSGFTSAVANGAECTFSISSGLVNLYSRNKTFTDPSLDVVPPRIISAVIYSETPNKLNLTYDRSVNQSLATAYEVDGTTVTSVTGQGLEWVLNLSTNLSPPSSGYTTFFYRSQNGDAVDSTNINYRVLPYIGKRITFINGGGSGGSEVYKRVYDHAYLGSGALNSSGQLAAVGEQVVGIRDEIGSLPMSYISGSASHLLTHSAPIKKADFNSSGFFMPNEADHRFRTSSISMPSVFTFTLIGAISNYKLFEEMISQDGFIQLGDLGQGGGNRIRNGSAFAGDVSYITDLATPQNQIFAITVEVSDVRPNIPEANGQDVSYLSSAKFQMNDTIESKIMSTLKASPLFISMGASTNNSHWLFLGMFFKDGSLSSQDKADVLADFKKYPQFNYGQALRLPLATNLILSRTGTIYTTTYNFTAYGGVAENISGRMVRYILMPGGSPTTAYYMPELDGLMTWDANNYTQYPINSQGNTVRVEVVVVDQSTPPKMYSVPQSYIL